MRKGTAPNIFKLSVDDLTQRSQRKHTNLSRFNRQNFRLTNNKTINDLAVMKTQGQSVCL